MNLLNTNVKTYATYNNALTKLEAELARLNLTLDKVRYTIAAQHREHDGNIRFAPVVHTGNGLAVMDIMPLAHRGVTIVN